VNDNMLLVDLVKSSAGNAGNPNLVAQKIMVTKDGKTFQQTFWVDPTADPNSDDHKRRKLEHHASNGNKADAIQLAKELGVNWKEHTHEGINWMRAHVAIKSHLSQHSNQQQSHQTAQVASVKSQPPPGVSTGFSMSTFQSLKNDKAEAMKYLKQVGITWPEHSHAPINWMRACMAANKADNSATATAKPPDPAPVAKIPEKTKEVEKPKPDNRTPRQKKIDSLLEGLSDEERKRAKQSGMIAGDKESQPYLDQLFDKYKALASGTQTPHHDTVRKQIASSADPKFAATRLAAGGVVNRMLLDNMKGYIKRMSDNSTMNMHGMVKNMFNAWRYQGANGTPVKSLKMGELPPAESARDFTGMLTSLKVLKDSKVHSPEVMKQLESDIHDVISAIDKDEHWKLMENRLKVKTNEVKADIDAAMTRIDGLGMISPLARANYLKERQQSGDRHLNTEGARARDIVAEGEYVSAKRKMAERAIKDLAYRDAFKNMYHMYESNKNIAKVQWVVHHPFKQISPLNAQELQALNNPMSDDEKHDFMMDKATELMTIKPVNAAKLKSSNKTTDDIKKEMKDQLDKALKDIMGDYNVKESELLEQGNINCVVSKVSKATATQISDKISADWDKKNHGSMRPVILGVYEISDLPVEAEYNKLKTENLKKYGSLNTRRFYHGTGSFATTLILGKSGQFKVGKAKVGRLLGDGIYLADKSSKSSQYISDDGMNRHGTVGSLMICDATLGNISSSRSGSADTIQAIKGQGNWAFLLNNEWCVKNPSAVLPKYLVHMELK